MWYCHRFKLPNRLNHISFFFFFFLCLSLCFVNTFNKIIEIKETVFDICLLIYLLNEEDFLRFVLFLQNQNLSIENRNVHKFVYVFMKYVMWNKLLSVMKYNANYEYNNSDNYKCWANRQQSNRWFHWWFIPLSRIFQINFIVLLISTIQELLVNITRINFANLKNSES